MGGATNFGTVTAWDDTGAEIGRASVYRPHEGTFMAHIQSPHTCRFGKAEWHLPAGGPVLTLHKTDAGPILLCTGAMLTMTVDVNRQDPATRAILEAMVDDPAAFAADGPKAGGSWRDRAINDPML